MNVAGKDVLGPTEAYAKSGIRVKNIEAKDEEGYNMLEKHLDKSRSFIADARASGGKCCVHCVAGINRSGVIVAAEKMLADRMNVLEVVAHIRRQRGNMCLLNESFQAELVSLARIEGLLGPRGGEPGSRLPASGPPPRSALDMN